MLGPVREFLQGLPSAGSNRAKVAALEHQIALLRGELAGRQADAATAAQLHRLQLAADSGRFAVLPARVVALGAADGFDWTVTLDAGSSSGVRAGQTVTDGYGLVGRVLHADAVDLGRAACGRPRLGRRCAQRARRTGRRMHRAGRRGLRVRATRPARLGAAGDHLVTGPAGSTSYQPGLSVGVVTAVRSSADGDGARDCGPHRQRNGTRPGRRDRSLATQPSGSPAALQPSGSR